MAFRLKPHETVPRAVTRMARKELAGGRATLIDERQPIAARIHHVRTAIKKLRALAQMVEPAVGRPARRAGRRLQKVARAVSGARDAEVVLETLDQVLDGAGIRSSGSPMRRENSGSVSSSAMASSAARPTTLHENGIGGCPG